MKLYVRGRKRVRDWHEMAVIPLADMYDSSRFCEYFPTSALEDDGELIVRCATKTLLLNGNYNLQLEISTEEIMILARRVLKKLSLEDALKVLAGVRAPAEDEDAVATA